MRRYTEISFDVLPIDNDGYHIMIKGKINDKDANFIIDTGASQTVFDKTTINDFVEPTPVKHKKGVSASVGASDINITLSVIGKISFNDFNLFDYKGIIIDLSHINDSYRKFNLPVIHAIIGGDILKCYDAVINYRLKKLRLTPKKKPDASHSNNR